MLVEREDVPKQIWRRPTGQNVTELSMASTESFAVVKIDGSDHR